MDRYNRESSREREERKKSSRERGESLKNWASTGVVIGGLVSVYERAHQANTSRRQEEKPRSSQAGMENPKTELKRRYLWLKKILENQPVNEPKLRKFQEDYNACFLIWDSIEALRGRYEQAEAVEMAYYQSGKLCRQMEDFQNFVTAEMPKARDAEKIILKGYNGYLNFLLLDFRDLKTALEEEKKEPAKQSESERRRRFLMNMSSQNECFEELAKLYQECYGIFEEGKKEGREAYVKLLGKMSDYPAYFRQGGFELDSLREVLEKKKAQMEAETEKAGELLKAFEELLTEEKMAPLQDEEAEKEELAARYVQYAEEMKEKILDRFPRED